VRFGLVHRARHAAPLQAMHPGRAQRGAFHQAWFALA
jgi:hypothetical protein